MVRQTKLGRTNREKEAARKRKRHADRNVGCAEGDRRAEAQLDKGTSQTEVKSRMYVLKLPTERSPVVKRGTVAETHTDAADSFCAAPGGTGLRDTARSALLYNLFKAIALGLMLIAFSALQAATVEWNGFYYDGNENDSSMTAGQFGACAYIRWFNSHDATGNLIWKSDVGDYMEMCCAWMQVVAGELINESFVRSREGYFYRRNLYGEEVLRSDYDIVFAKEDDVFLAVAVARNYDTPSEVLYGWVQFHQGSDGTVSLVTSALDVSGGSIVVGAIPEPSCTLLLLAGGALLALGRRR